MGRGDGNVQAEVIAALSSRDENYRANPGLWYTLDNLGLGTRASGASASRQSSLRRAIASLCRRRAIDRAYLFADAEGEGLSRESSGSRWTIVIRRPLAKLDEFDLKDTIEDVNQARGRIARHRHPLDLKVDECHVCGKDAPFVAWYERSAATPGVVLPENVRLNGEAKGKPLGGFYGGSLSGL